MEPVFLSGDLQQAVLAAAQEARDDPQADLAWVFGVDALSAELERIADSRRLPTGALGEPRRYLLRALERDPGMADGWLCLLVVERLQPSEPLAAARASEALALSADRLGEQQTRYARPLSVLYVPLLVARVRVQTASDARLLHAGELAAWGRTDEAEAWLALCADGLGQALATQALIELLARSYSQASETFETLRDHQQFAPEAHLGLALALGGLGLYEQAAEQARLAVWTSFERRFSLYARYLLCLLLREVDVRAAREEFELLALDLPEVAPIGLELDELEEAESAFVSLVRAFRGDARPCDPPFAEG